jgi:hypothetical protein
MKNFLLCIVTSIFIISCSSDSDIESPENVSLKTEATVDKTHIAENAVNPFDSNGKKIYEALALYYQNNKSPNSVSELTKQIVFIHEECYRKEENAKRLIIFNDEIVESIMTDPDNCMIAIVENSLLGNYAKTSLINFLQNLITKRQQEFNISYDFITAYESAVTDDEVLTSEETETMLTVASISRYSLYSATERRDRDWEILIGSKPVAPFFEKNEASVITIIALLNNLI